MSRPSKEKAIEVATAVADEEPPTCTDDGNAERFARTVAGDLFWVPQWKSWVFWRGDRWVTDAEEFAVKEMLNVVRRIPSEVLGVAEEEVRKRILRWSMTSLSATRVKGALALARSHRRLLAKPSDFDNEPYLLNCLNGTIELRSGKLRPHRREDMLTQQVTCAYDSEAVSPDWEKAVSDALGSDEELVAYLQRVLGYALTGSTEEEKFFFFYGVPGAGKGTIIESFAGMLGDYARTLSSRSLAKGLPQSGDGASGDIARLRAARFASASEFNRGDRLNEALINTITGGDTVTARFLYQGDFEFLPEFKLFLSANHHPRLGGGPLSGIWRRVQVIPFQHKPPKVDPKLKVRLRSEKAKRGVLRWAVEGCLEWQLDGLGEPPDQVDEAKAEYQEESDPFSTFIREVVTPSPDSQVPVSEMYAAYKRWAGESGVRAVASKQALGKILKERGLEQTTKEETREGKRRVWRAWINVELKAGHRGTAGRQAQ